MSQQPAKKEASGKPQQEKGGSSALGCAAVGCKKPDHRFTFCDEHYEQFKFGLIKKNGQPASDYEKKYSQYQAYRAKQGSKQVA